MKAREIMSSPVVTIRQDRTLEDAAQLMLEEEVGCLSVVDELGKLVGILTEEDFMAHEESVPWSFFKAPKLFDQWLDQPHIEAAYERARSLTIKKNMSAPVRTVGPEDHVSTVVELMLSYTISHVPVVEDGRPVGIVTRRDMLRMIGKRSGGS